MTWLGLTLLQNIWILVMQAKKIVMQAKKASIIMGSPVSPVSIHRHLPTQLLAHALQNIVTVMRWKLVPRDVSQDDQRSPDD